MPFMYKIENNYPDCVLMELDLLPVRCQKEAEPNEDYISQKADYKNQIDLFLTIYFGQYKKVFNSCNLFLGLKHGALRLKLDNGIIPLKNIVLSNNFETSYEVQFQEKETHTNQKDINIAFNPKIGAGNSKSLEFTKISKLREYQVTTQIISDEIIWHFWSNPANLILQGLLIKEKLATVNIVDFPLSGEVIFSIPSRSDVYDSWDWLGKDHELEKSIIENKMVNYFVNQEYISKLEFKYD